MVSILQDASHALSYRCITAGLLALRGVRAVSYSAFAWQCLAQLTLCMRVSSNAAIVTARAWKHRRSTKTDTDSRTAIGQGEVWHFPRQGSTINRPVQT